MSNELLFTFSSPLVNCWAGAFTFDLHTVTFALWINHEWCHTDWKLTYHQLLLCFHLEGHCVELLASVDPLLQFLVALLVCVMLCLGNFLALSSGHPLAAVPFGGGAALILFSCRVAE